MASVTCCAQVPSILPVRVKTGNSPVLLAEISIQSLYHGWSRKGFWTFCTRAGGGGTGPSFHDAAAPSDNDRHKEKEDRHDEEDCPVEHALAKRNSCCVKQDKGQDGAGNGQVFVRNAPDDLHTGKETGCGICFLIPKREEISQTEPADLLPGSAIPYKKTVQEKKVRSDHLPVPAAGFELERAVGLHDRDHHGLLFFYGLLFLPGGALGPDHDLLPFGR